MQNDDDGYDDEGMEGKPNGFSTGIALFLVLALVVWAMKGG